MSGISDALKRMAKPALKRLVIYLRNKPLYKNQVAKALRFVPGVDARLRGFARNVPVNVVEALGLPSAQPDYAGAWREELPRRLPRGNGERILYIFVDHTVRCPVNTGMQRVTRRLSRALIEAGETVRFVVWDPEGRQLVLATRDQVNHLGQWNGPALSAAEMAVYPDAAEPARPAPAHQRQDGHWLIVPEVTHITYHPEPTTLDAVTAAKRCGLRSAFIFYDAIPLRRAEMAAAAVLHAEYMQLLLLADLLIPISHWSGRDLAAFFQTHDGVDAAALPPIVPTPLPGESQLAQRATDPTPAAEGRKLILSVGSIEPRKNQASLIAAFERYCAENPDTSWELALVGNLHPDVAPVIDRAVHNNPRVKYLRHLSDADLDAAYRACAFTVFPSVEEGFGLPILESLWYAKPCVCANFGSMGEVAAGGGCLMIDTRDPDALYDAVKRLMDDPAEIDALAREAVARPIDGWDAYADRVADLLTAQADPLRRLGTVYYWVDHTCGYSGNTGIQRVVRGLARALCDVGVAVVPVKWIEAERRFAPPSTAELAHLAQWNGPAPDAWAPWRDPAQASAADWLLIPELTTYLPATRLEDIKAATDALGLRCAWIFYDAIPWNLRGMYPPQAAAAHRAYMEGLNAFAKVLTISRYSRDSLIRFLAGTPGRTAALDERIEACPLPDEFLETPRVTTVKPPNRGGVVRILSVGTVEPRKNHLALLEAFARLRAKTAKRVELVIAGGKPYPELAAQVQDFIDKTPGVSWVVGADDARLRELYDACDFTVYPSLEEGFGLPIAESLWNARPCICRNASSMKEVAAEGGGCLMVETADSEAMAEAMLRLTDDDELREELGEQATLRRFRTWREYGRDVALALAEERETPSGRRALPPAAVAADDPLICDRDQFYREFVSLRPRPLLSLCVTTYNRAGWLAVNLANIFRLLPVPSDDVEIFVCDNASTDNTEEVVAPYLGRSDFRYRRNPVNVGMLGNLRVTASRARGRYVWILGDDDLLKPGGVERVISAIRDNPGIGLVYLNYAYTREEDPAAVGDLEAFLENAPAIVEPGPDVTAPIREICTASENVFTAIYCLAFRRDHALRAYNQDVDGKPFASLLTCIPTTYYVLNYMMDAQACWLGQPQLVVNMNVSWIKYAPLWVLERVPEVWDLAERLGADPDAVDRWRAHHMQGVAHYFDIAMKTDAAIDPEDFSAARLVSRIKHLPVYAQYAEGMRAAYAAAHAENRPVAVMPLEAVFPREPAA